MPRFFLKFFFVCAVHHVIGTVGFIHNVTISNDARSHFFITNFGFREKGYLSIAVDDLKVSGTELALDPWTFGLYISISTTDQSQALDNVEKCILKTPPKPEELKFNITKSFFWSCTVPKDGLYNLFFINCAHKPVSFMMKIIEYNEIDGVKCYLPAGDMALPVILAVATCIYMVLALVWTIGAMKGKSRLVNRVHYLMTALLFFKILTLFSKAVEYHNLKMTGNAEGWNIPFYIFTFCKGIMLFVVIGLIGTGYTFFKHFLSDRDRKILMVVLPLQVLANVAQIESLEGNLGSIAWSTWTTIFQVVEVVCCMAVVLPIALSIKHLKAAATTDGKAARSMEKLKLFRQFYLIVLGYLYFTRVVVVFTRLAVPFTVAWLNTVLYEVATIAFYCVIGYKFQPQEDSPYFEVHKEDLDKEIEMQDISK